MRELCRSGGGKRPRADGFLRRLPLQQVHWITVFGRATGVLAMFAAMGFGCASNDGTPDTGHSAGAAATSP